MGTSQLLSWLHSLLAAQLFEVAGTKITLATLFAVIVVFTVTLLLGTFVRRVVHRLFARRGVVEAGHAGALASLLRYVVLAIGFSIAVQTAGINLSALFAAGAVFAVGLGFAMQNIAQNFVAGVILLLERSIKPGDVLEVEGSIVRVIELGIRSTIVQSRDRDELIVPNSVLVQSTVKNYTLQDSLFRVRASVGVSYDSDMARVRAILERVGNELDWRRRDHDPQVLMLGFRESAVEFELAVWIDDPWKARVMLSRIYEAIWAAFQREKIVIPFPQLDVRVAATETVPRPGLRALNG